MRIKRTIQIDYKINANVYNNTQSRNSEPKEGQIIKKSKKNSHFSKVSNEIVIEKVGIASNRNIAIPIEIEIVEVKVNNQNKGNSRVKHIKEKTKWILKQLNWILKSNQVMKG